VTHSTPRWRLLAALPIVFALGGCGTTVLLDKFDTGTVGSAPAQPTTGSSTVTGHAAIAANPQDPASADHWLRLSRTSPTESTLSEYFGAFTENVTKKKVSVDLVGFVPSSAPIMLTVFFESKVQPQIPLMHIDLLPNGNIRVNDNQIIGTFKFDTLVGFFINFDLTGTSPSASILIRGGGNDANTTVAIPVNAANFGLGQVHIRAPFEGVNAPNGSFLVNDIFALKPN